MSQLTIIANIHAKPDQIEKVKAALLKLVPITRAEEGCLTYTLHQNNENPAPFTRTGSRVSCGSSTCRHGGHSTTLINHISITADCTFPGPRP